MDWGDVAIAGLAVLLVFVGAALTIGIELARGQLERKQRRQDQRDDFQRVTLLALQDALYQFVEAMAFSVEDYRRQSVGQLPVSPFLGLPWPIAARTAQARIVQLTARVADDRLREIVQRYRDAFNATLFIAETVDEAETALKSIHDLHKQANERIGELIRAL